MSGATLLGFVLARIAEDEVRASKAPDDPGSDVPDRVDVAWLRQRVVSDCQAKRRAVTYLSRRLGRPFDGEVAETVLRFLAVPYSGHPDYSSEWDPDRRLGR